MILPAVASVLLAACAAGPTRVTSDQTLERYLGYAGEPVDRINAIRIVSWEALSDDRIVLRTGPNEAYLVTVYATCRDLRYTNAIRVISQSTHAVTRFDKIAVGRDTCPIREIRPLDVKQMEADAVALRKYREAEQGGND
jgi:hypothetical protein